MPYLGLGVYLIQRDQANEVFSWAIRLGYRLFDTAAFYGNEAEVGRQLKRAIFQGKTSSLPLNFGTLTTDLIGQLNPLKRVSN